MEFSFDIDLSHSAGGVNAAIYFVPMNELDEPNQITAKISLENYGKNEYYSQNDSKKFDRINATLDPLCYWQSSRAYWDLSWGQKNCLYESKDSEAAGFGYCDSQGYCNGFGTIEIDCLEATSMGAQTTLHFDIDPKEQSFENNSNNVFNTGYFGQGTGLGGPYIPLCGKIEPFAVNMQDAGYRWKLR